MKAASKRKSKATLVNGRAQSAAHRRTYRAGWRLRKKFRLEFLPSLGASAERGCVRRIDRSRINDNSGMEHSDAVVAFIVLRPSCAKSRRDCGLQPKVGAFASPLGSRSEMTLVRG